MQTELGVLVTGYAALWKVSHEFHLDLSIEHSQEMWVRSLGQEDPLEKEMATHSSIAWRSPWTEEPGRLWSMGLAESDTTI